MNDTLQYLFNQHPFLPERLGCLVIGEKNVAIMLKNGSIGVCSTLCQKLEGSEHALQNPDFKRYDHRVVICAWINANVNYKLQNLGDTDIFSAIDFSIFRQVTMVGYFGTLAQKIRSLNVNLKIFDLDEEEKPVEPIKNLNQTLSEAEAVILTATSISNNTFNDLVSSISATAKVYILGPSTPLTPLLFNIPCIAGLFGAQFQKFDSEVMSSISQGGGTRSFLGRMQKVYLIR